MLKKLSLAVTVFLLALASVSHAQTLRTLVHQPPSGAGIGFLLTDGTVMFQGNNAATWWKLTPDSLGSYFNGTWSQLASLPSGYSPLYFASAVLADGRLVIVGGEYNFGTFTLTNLGAIYDPVANTWTSLAPPAGWDFIGDSPSVVLPDGKFLVGNKLDERVAALDPATLTWVPVAVNGSRRSKSDFNAEEGWTLLPDGTVLTCDVQHAPHAERLIYVALGSRSLYQTWVSAGSTMVDLHSPPKAGCLAYGDHGQYCYFPPGEIGPAMLRPNGTVFATGSSSIAGPGHTAIYTPPAVPTGLGTWTPGPDFPNGDYADDSYAALLPNGNVLVLGSSGKLYEFNGVNLIPELNASGALLVLPTGEVIVSASTVKLYTPSNTTYSPSWAPAITTYPGTVSRGSTHQIFGKQFNGLSQAAAFGDEDETATNYPLVRITNQSTGHVFYARTHGHSTMAVATGNATVSTNFDVPSGMETGASSLQVVANGIPSPAVAITVF
jgi:hypothetical protein